MHNRQAPIQEERSKALGKLTLAGSLALLLIASLTGLSVLLPVPATERSVEPGSDAAERDARGTGRVC